MPTLIIKGTYNFKQYGGNKQISLSTKLHTALDVQAVVSDSPASLACKFPQSLEDQTKESTDAVMNKTLGPKRGFLTSHCDPKSCLLDFVVSKSANFRHVK